VREDLDSPLQIARGGMVLHLERGGICRQKTALQTGIGE